MFKRKNEINIEEQIEKREIIEIFKNTNFEELDFKSSLSEDEYNEFEELFELEQDFLSCYKILTLNEYIFCEKNNIDICDLIEFKNQEKCSCKDCDITPMFMASANYSVIITFIALIIAIIIKFLILKE